MRIICISPAAGEILAALGATSQIVARSEDCVHPAGVAELVVVAFLSRETDDGGHFDGREIDDVFVRGLGADLLIGGDDGNCVGTQTALLKALAENVKMVDLTFTCLAEVYENTLKLGELVGKRAEAMRLVTHWKAEFDHWQQHVNAFVTGPRVEIMVQSDAPILLGGRWMAELVELAGGTCVLTTPGEPDLEVSDTELATGDLDYLVLATPDGDSFRQVDREIELIQVEDSTVFTTPGTRLVKAFALLVRQLHDLPGDSPQI